MSQYFVPSTGGGGGGEISLNVIVVDSNDTYTPSANLIGAFFEGVAGGGGGGGAESGPGAGGAAGGGSCGQYINQYFTALEIGASQAITIGQGGAGSATYGDGGNGTNTVIGTLATLLGGNGGGVSGVTADFGIARGGAESGSDTYPKINGQCGGKGAYTISVTSGFGYGGDGGSTPLGAGGSGGVVEGSAGAEDGVDATSYGGGGGGAISIGVFGASAGGDGADGIVIITEVIQAS